MQLSPRYDGPPLLVVDLPAGDPAGRLAGQLHRFTGTLAGLSDEEWAAPTRCEGWTAKDVVVHLGTAIRFWDLSVRSAVRGEPTRFLVGFDPVATPAQMVAGAREQTPADALAELVAASTALVEALTGLDPESWDLPAEAPPGHLPLRAVAAHALWDSWVHERDVLLPLGRPTTEDPDEVAECLRYSAALGPAFLAMGGSDRTGAYVVDATGPDTRFVVELGSTVRLHEGPAPEGAPRLGGPAVDLVEALSFRAPLDLAVPAGDAWMFGGLGPVFDAVEPAAPGGATPA